MSILLLLNIPLTGLDTASSRNEIHFAGTGGRFSSGTFAKTGDLVIEFSEKFPQLTGDDGLGEYGLRDEQEDTELVVLDMDLLTRPLADDSLSGVPNFDSIASSDT